MITRDHRPPSPPRLVIVGSIGLDTIETPATRRENILGGSASYACAAASFFSPVGMVGVVGEDFTARHRAVFERFSIDLQGMQQESGLTFRWSGRYEQNMDVRQTLSTELNVFSTFRPELPPAYRRAPYLFLANIAPELQHHVLDQVRKPRFVMADTMDLWIENARDSLDALLPRIDLLTLNESEARHLTGFHALPRAARHILDQGPTYVLIKKGEHGSILFSNDGIRLMPAFPLEEVHDPTGAGDTFAGGLMGRLARGRTLNENALYRAMAVGNVIASFGVEAFGLDRLNALSSDEIDARMRLFRSMLHGAF